MMVMQEVALAQEIDLSNVIRRPKCVIEVNVKLLETKFRSTLLTEPAKLDRFPVEVRISFNNVQIELPAGFAEIFWDVSRIIPLRGENACGFQVERGDASTSNRLAVYFFGDKIKKIERFDFRGRVVSTTNFNYPGPVVLD